MSSLFMQELQHEPMPDERNKAAMSAAESYERQCDEYYNRIAGRGRPLTKTEKQLVGAHASVVRSHVIREWRISERDFHQALSDLRRQRRCAGHGI